MITVVKVGGAIIENEISLKHLLTQFEQLKGKKVIIHGGGRTSTDLMYKLGMTAQIINGRRVTDDATLEIVTMVYAGINKKIVALLQSLDVNAIGLCGADGNILKATKRNPNPIDFGFVGDVKKEDVDEMLLHEMLAQNLIPVFAPLTHDGKGSLLNTNADTIASVVAQALQPAEAVRLLYVFEKPGLLKDSADDKSLINSFSMDDYEQSKSEDYIHSGMHPKLLNAFEAKKELVNEVFLCNIENMASLSKGTQIVL